MKMITCWFTKREMARRLDDETPLPPPVQHHLRHCAPCQQFYGTQSRLTRQLSHEARRQATQPSPFLGTRIMAAVRQAATTEPQPAAPPRWLWRTTLAVAAIVAALTVLPHLVMQRPPPPHPSTQWFTKVIQLSGGEVLEQATGQTIEEWSVSLDQPLETEIAYVMNDARSAIDSLANRFIPETLLTKGTTLNH